MILNRAILMEGFLKGLRSTFELSKVIIPTTMIITVLKNTGVLETLANRVSPMMSYWGLPGEAAVVLLSGYLVNIYAAIGSMMVLDLGFREITILALMLGFCHSLIVELLISKKAGSPISFILPLRLGISLFSGLIVGGLLS